MKQEETEMETPEQISAKKTANLIKQLQGLQSNLFLKAKDKSFNNVSISFEGIYHLKTQGTTDRIAKITIDYDRNKTTILIKRAFVLVSMSDLLGLDMKAVVDSVAELRLYDAYNLFCRSFCQENKTAIFTELN